MKRSAPSPTDKNQESPKSKAKKESKSSNALLYPVMDIFKEKLDFLDWKDAVAFGAVNPEFRKAFLEKRDTLVDFQPLLTVLEGLVGSNRHHYCGKVYAPISQRVCTCASMLATHDYIHPDNQVLAQLDPRYQEMYDSLSAYEKCVQMVYFLTTIVSNMRGQFHFADFGNPDNMPNVVGRVTGWSLGDGVVEGELLPIYPRRAAFAFNVALLAFASGAMECGDDLNFNDAFLGDGDIEDGGDSFGVPMAEMVTEMAPFRDKDLVHALKEIYPNTATLAILGPTLVSKVILCAPAFAIVPPSSENYDDEAVQLPSGLEIIRKKDLMEAGIANIEEIFGPEPY